MFITPSNSYVEIRTPTVSLVDGRLGPGESACLAKVVAGESSYTEQVQG